MISQRACSQLNPLQLSQYQFTVLRQSGILESNGTQGPLRNKTSLTAGLIMPPFQGYNPQRHLERQSRPPSPQAASQRASPGVKTGPNNATSATYPDQVQEGSSQITRGREDDALPNAMAGDHPPPASRCGRASRQSSEATSGHGEGTPVRPLTAAYRQRRRASGEGVGNGPGPRSTTTRSGANGTRNAAGSWRRRSRR